MKYKGFFKIKGEDDTKTEFEFELVDDAVYSPQEKYDVALEAIIELIDINYDEENILNLDIENALKRLKKEGHSESCALTQIFSSQDCYCKPLKNKK